MRILITGGAGFIGTNLAKYLLQQAEKELGMNIDCLVVLDKLTYAGNRSNIQELEKDPRFHFIHGDINDGKVVSELLHQNRINAVMHLAAESHVDRSLDNPADFINTNVVGTYHLLESFKSYLESSKASQSPASDRYVFLHVSTDEVFGSLALQEPSFTKKSPYQPSSPYSASKAGSDHLCMAYMKSYNLPVIVTNCSNNYGPYQFPEKLMPKIILNTLSNKPIPVYGTGDNIRDWIYVMDHCRALALAAWKGEMGEQYLIGGSCELSNIELVHKIIHAIDELGVGVDAKEAIKNIHYVSDRPGHDLRYSINSDHAHAKLGWNPVVDFDSGIKTTIKWYLDHLDWAKNIELNQYDGRRLGASGKQILGCANLFL
jgi:dTDP-glucose 4,6-dehydratase